MQEQLLDKQLWVSYREFARPVNWEVVPPAGNDVWTGGHGGWGTGKRTSGQPQVSPAAGNAFWTDGDSCCREHLRPADFRNRWEHTSSRLGTGCSWWSWRICSSPPGRNLRFRLPASGPLEPAAASLEALRIRLPTLWRYVEVFPNTPSTPQSVSYAFPGLAGKVDDLHYQNTGASMSIPDTIPRCGIFQSDFHKHNP